jgi:hypothetical protein
MTYTKELAFSAICGAVFAIVAIVALIIGTGLIGHHSAVHHPAVHESKVIYSQPITWHGMNCVAQTDTNGNVWVNDCTTNGS